MATLFSKIINGEITCHKIAENEHFFAFLDIMPNTEGHTLVVPKQETDYIFDLEDEIYVGLQLFAKKVAIALKKAIICERIGVIVVGLEVPHAHIHLIPINKISDMDLTKKTPKNAEELEIIAQKIRKFID
jgi:histidine triad (HIT) family protein